MPIAWFNELIALNQVIIRFTDIIRSTSLTISLNRTKHNYNNIEKGGEILYKMYTCAQIADHYGVKVITVWDWIRQKKLPAIRIGREYRISEDDMKVFEDTRRTIPVKGDEQ